MIKTKGSLHTTKQSPMVAILCHGFTDNKENYLKIITDNIYQWLLPT